LVSPSIKRHGLGARHDACSAVNVHWAPVEFQVDIWLRGENHATTQAISPVARVPRAWTEGDVAAVLIGMLRAIDRAKHPDAPADRPVGLRGFSWIVNPFESGGVVIALEMTLGAVVGGPFELAESVLSGMIQRVMEESRFSGAPVLGDSGAGSSVH